MTEEKPHVAEHRMITMAMPRSPELLAAIGRVAIRHGQMDFILRMTIKSICEITPEEAVLAMARSMSGPLRSRIEKLAKTRLGDGHAFLRLQALLERCRRLSERRHELLHGLFAAELDGEEVFRGDGLEFRPLPKVEDLDAVAIELEQVTAELNYARLQGFLSEAMEASKPIK